MGTMKLPLTEEQQQAIDSHAVDGTRLIDPRTNSAYVLVPENEFETIREVLEDERRQRTIREVARRNAAGRSFSEFASPEPSEATP